MNDVKISKKILFPKLLNMLIKINSEYKKVQNVTIRKASISEISNYHTTFKSFYNTFVIDEHTPIYKDIDIAEIPNYTFYCGGCSQNEILTMVKRTAVFSSVYGKKEHCHIYIDSNERKRNILNGEDLTDHKGLDKRGEGLTTAGLTDPSRMMIILTKKEEMAKLLLHELLHFYDIQPNIDNVFVKKLEKKWNISNTFHLYEAHCELFGIILNCMFLACEYDYKKNLNMSEIQLSKLFTYYISHERKYSLYLTARLLKAYGYEKNNFKNFFLRKEGKIMTNGSIPAYNIVRGIFFYNLDEYLELLEDNFKPSEKYKNLPEETDEYFATLKLFFPTLKGFNIRYSYYDPDYKNADYIQKLVKNK